MILLSWASLLYVSPLLLKMLQPERESIRSRVPEFFCRMLVFREKQYQNAGFWVDYSNQHFRSWKLNCWCFFAPPEVFAKSSWKICQNSRWSIGIVASAKHDILFQEQTTARLRGLIEHIERLRFQHTLLCKSLRSKKFQYALASEIQNFWDLILNLSSSILSTKAYGTY